MSRTALVKLMLNLYIWGKEYGNIGIRKAITAFMRKNNTLIDAEFAVAGIFKVQGVNGLHIYL